MADSKVSKVRQKKEQIVSELTAKVQKAKGFVFADYQGLTHQQLENLKRALKNHDAEFVATKNTLLLRSLQPYLSQAKIDLVRTNNQSSDSKPQTETLNFEGPTATLFIYNDPIEPIKELAKSIKALKLPVVKLGIIEGKVIDAAQVDTLSKLPPVNILKALLLGQLLSPVSGLHRALNWNLQKLVLTLNAVKSKKQ